MNADAMLDFLDRYQKAPTPEARQQLVRDNRELACAVLRTQDVALHSGATVMPSGNKAVRIK